MCTLQRVAGGDGFLTRFDVHVYFYSDEIFKVDATHSSRAASAHTSSCIGCMVRFNMPTDATECSSTTIDVSSPIRLLMLEIEDFQVVNVELYLAATKLLPVG